MAVAARTEAVWDERLPGTIGDTVTQIEESGGRAVAIRADLLDRADIPRLVELTREALGPITVLVNNAAFTAPGRPPKAGTAPPKPAAAPGPAAVSAPAAAGGAPPRADWPAFLGTPRSAFQRHFEISVFAAYELMQLVAVDMLDAGHGAIINVTSGASRMPGDGPWADRSQGMLPGYGGSKAALEHLTQCAAFELQDRRIAVNALSPSKAIITPGVQYYSHDFADVASSEGFAEAAVRLVLVDPDVVTGRTIGHLDVLDGSFRPWGAQPAT